MIYSGLGMKAMEDIFNCCSTNFIVKFESLFLLLCGSVFSLLIVVVIERFPSFNKKSGGFHCTDLSCTHCGNSWLEVPRKKYESIKGFSQPTDRIAQAFSVALRNNRFCIPFNCNPSIWRADKLTQKHLDDFLLLENNFYNILEEYKLIENDPDANWNNVAVPSGKWSTFHIVNQGVIVEENTSKCPKTEAVINGLQTFARNCYFAHIFFSKIEPNSIVEPHSGPTNLRIRAHLALDVGGECQLFVEDEIFTWTTGKVLSFDDSKVHSVRVPKDATSPRSVLVVDLWNPSLSTQELKILKHVFQCQK